MTDFIESPRFPDDVSYGAVGGPKYSTDVIIVQSGYEKRNSNWLDPLYEFDVSHSLKTQTQLNDLIKFFRTVKGKGLGFRFKDWQDYFCDKTESYIGDVDLTLTKTFNLYKIYQSGINDSDYRKLSKPVVGTFVLYKNNIIYNTINYTIDYTNGIVVLDNFQLITDIFTFECEFDIPCRFNTDSMRASIDDYQVFSWGQIPLIEIRI